MGVTMTGVIVTIMLNRGFGFIRGEDRQSRFFHAKDMLPNLEAFDLLHEGQAVTFTPTDTPKGPRAVEVKVT